jgi:Holliday junction resolvasome RuvABC endonuclease subunit
MTGASVQSEMVGVLKVWCSDNKVEHVGVNMTEIKRHATGKGNAGKPDMVAAAKKKWPHKTIASHDEADALWLLDYIVTKKLAGIPFS